MIVSFVEFTLLSIGLIDDCYSRDACMNRELISPLTRRRENALRKLRMLLREPRAIVARRICQTSAVFAMLVSFVLIEPVLGQDKTASENLLPSNTTAWVSVPDAEALEKAIEGTQFGAMMNDPKVRPFVDDLVQQLRGYLNEQNIRFGMKLSDIEEVHSGEICIAGVLKKPLEGTANDVAPEHGIVLLVDVEGSEDKAAELMGRVHKKLTEIEATEEKIEIHGIQTSKWSFKKPEGLRKRQFAFHAIVGGWMLATDNENTFREILGRVTETATGTSTLVENEAFKVVQESCEFAKQGFDSHVRWFVEPFGYVQLAQAIADSQASNDGNRNNIAEKFEEEGFSAIKGVGGVVSFATGEHETVHRTMIFAPPVAGAPEGERYLRAAGMLDFRNTSDDALDPPMWVPENSAGFVTFTWDLENALNKVGYIIDKTSGTPGSFERALESMKNDPEGPRVDVRDLISKLNRRISVCSITELPIDDASERIVFGIKIHADEDYVADCIFRLFRNDAVSEDFMGSKILVVDTASEVELGAIEIEDDFNDEFGGNALEDTSEDEDEEDEPKPAKPLFEKRVFVVHNGYLLIGNNEEQIKSILKQMPDSPGDQLAKAADYTRVNEALASLAGDQPPSFRHFGRMDKTVRTNYEMMRTGKMAQSKTLLAQLLNRAYTTDETPEDFVREQEVDGTKMPEDFEGEVAQYFGPTGMVVHTTDQGWVITGVILKKDGEQLSTDVNGKKGLADGR